MNKFRENLVERMGCIYDFDNPIVLEFCRLCETWPEGEEWDKELETLVKCHEAFPFSDDDEEDEPDWDYNEDMGFDPYLGCYTDDC